MPLAQNDATQIRCTRVMGFSRKNILVNRAQEVIHSDPEIMSGTPVFVGVRVPVYNLFEDWRPEIRWTSS